MDNIASMTLTVTLNDGTVWTSTGSAFTQVTLPIAPQQTVTLTTGQTLEVVAA